MATPSSKKELVDAQTHIWKHCFSYISSMSLKCAIQLGIPDVIYKHGKPMTLSEIADAIPINREKARGLNSLMRVLVDSEFLEKVEISEDDNAEEEEAYALTQASRLLLKDEPFSLAPFSLFVLAPTVMDPFHHLAEWFQNDHPSPFFTKNGTTVWEHAGIDERWDQIYNEAMACDARLVASILVKECKQIFAGVKTMVDVGGGTGMVAKAIADAFPAVKCVVLDLPHVVAGLEGSQNLRFITGDMFKSVPHADAVFLKWNLHMWTDEACVKLLKNCKEAITESNGGKVIIFEMVVDEDHKGTGIQYLVDMHTMTRFAGGERTKKEWAKLFFAAGFTRYKITPVLGLRSIVEVFP